MGRLTVTLLFTRVMTTEPAGILQCDTSGEYLPFYFNDWREAIHYIQWSNNKKLNSREHETFEEWSEKYGYSGDEEEFNGDLNEFKSKQGKSNEWIVWTVLGPFDSSTDLTKISAW